MKHHHMRELILSGRANHLAELLARHRHAAELAERKRIADWVRDFGVHCEGIADGIMDGAHLK